MCVYLVASNQTKQQEVYIMSCYSEQNFINPLVSEGRGRGHVLEKTKH